MAFESDQERAQYADAIALVKELAAAELKRIATENTLTEAAQLRRAELLGCITASVQFAFDFRAGVI